MHQISFPIWYSKSLPYLDVISKLGFGALLAGLVLRKGTKEQKQFTPLIGYQHMLKGADLPFWKETGALALGVGAADITGRIFQTYLDRLHRRKELKRLMALETLRRSNPNTIPRF
jgi:hypothetical protein